MNVKQSMLRLAAATTVTVFMTVGAVGPVHAADGKTDDTSASSHKTQQESESTDDTTTDESTSSDNTDGNASTTGSYDEPQPESTADENDGGANAGTCPEGQYCSTRDGSASANGEGDGEAKGRPCAGCVGRADNKNPKGQVGEDPSKNKGYECDDNKGVGKGNPAHTGCTEGSTVCPEGATMSDEGECVVAAEQTVCPEGATMSDAGECVVPAEEAGVCPEDATMNDEGECVLPPKEVVCPEDATMNDAGQCVVPALPALAQAGSAATAVVAGVETGAPADAQPQASTANRAPAKADPASGILPSTGAGAYGLVILAGLGLLAAGGVLIARKRPQANR